MREYGPGHPLVFSHIPKTAGNALRVALQQCLQPPVFVGGLDTSLFGGYDDIDHIRGPMRPLIYTSPDQLAADATLVSGHISPWTTMTRYPGADHISVFRVPQVRILSQWLHSRSVSEFNLRHWGSAGEAFRVGWLPLDEYLRQPMIAPNIDNTITRFLAWPHPLLSRTEFLDERHDDEVLGAATARLEQLAHVNVVENPDFMSELSAWLGREVPRTRLNERTSVPPRKRPDLVAEVAGSRELLDHRTRLDRRLWSQVVGQRLPEADPDDLLERTIQGAVERYDEMLRQPHRMPLPRRVVEEVYGFGVRLDPRRWAKRT